jgi:beta-glucosidase
MSVTLNLQNVRGVSAEDADAVRHVDGLSNRIFLDPMLRGTYPQDVLDDLRHITDFAFIRDGDPALINAPLDVLGINYYFPTLVAGTSSGYAPAEGATRYDWNDVAPYPGTDLAYQIPQEGPYTAMGWRIEAPSLTELLLRVHRDYPEIPLMITENGAAFDDVVSADGAVHDADRIAYLHDHIAAVHDAIQSGADIRAYFLWSLLDNFEWAFGYSKRFGIVHVDYETLARTVKDSGDWYREVIAQHGVN